jgi:hypothetical protein
MTNPVRAAVPLVSDRPAFLASIVIRRSEPAARMLLGVLA